MNESDYLHAFFLQRIVYDLSLINEDKYKTKWIMREGIYLQDDTLNNNKLSDLIIGYQDFNLSLVELKRSTKRRTKALEQLISSKELVTDCFNNYNIKAAKIVYYKNNSLLVEDVTKIII